MSKKSYKGAGIKDDCYYKVKSRYTVWPSAYGSGALSKCRKVGAENWGVRKKKKGGIFDKEKEKGLKGWFERNDGKGWVDCISGEQCGGKKAGKKSLCRPTKSDCPSNSKLKKLESKKKMGESVSWKKSGGVISLPIMHFKYGGKLIENQIREYTIDKEKIKFFGNVNGNTSVKFNRVAMIASRYDQIIENLNKIIKEEKEKFTEVTTQKYNLAIAFLLIIKTGIRIGNESSAEGFMSTYKEKGKEILAKTYGLTTLLKEHVSTRNGITKFDFTGKKHVNNTFRLSKSTSDLLKPILKSDFTPVFNITERELTSFIKDVTSPYFSSKDFRTFRANIYANQAAKKEEKPKIKKEYREAVKNISDYVAEKLNNTPSVAKSSYIDPLTFWYYLGKPDELPSRLPENKKEGGNILKQEIFTKDNNLMKKESNIENIIEVFKKGGRVKVMSKGGDNNEDNWFSRIENYVVDNIFSDRGSKKIEDIKNQKKELEIDTEKLKAKKIAESELNIKDKIKKLLSLPQYSSFTLTSDGVVNKINSNKILFEEFDVMNPQALLDSAIIFKNGGKIPDRYKEMGFTEVGQKKKSTRKGKKWMVLAKKGDKYKVVHGGDSSMEDYTQHKDKERRAQFWNRMGGKNSKHAKDPFSPLYWAKKLGTW